MKTLLSLAALGAASAAAAAAPAPFAGRWITVDGKALVEIGPCGRQICGRIASAGDRRDQRMPHVDLEHRPGDRPLVLHRQ